MSSSYRKAMPYVCKDLEVERLPSVSQDLGCPGTLLRHEELISAWHGEEQRCCKLSVLQSCMCLGSLTVDTGDVTFHDE